MKLELRYLAPYLPYKIKCAFYGEDSECGEFYGISSISDIDILNGFVVADIPKIGNCEFTFRDFKPILHPLSDLTKEITVGGETFVPIEELLKLNYPKSVKTGRYSEIEIDTNGYPMAYYKYNSTKYITIRTFSVPDKLEYWIVQKLLEWHFDVFGLIESGLTIDINSLDE